MGLRDYQVEAKTQVRAAYARGIKKVLLKMPTGAGKTTVFSDILKDVAKIGNRGVMVVRGRMLVDQASERLFRDEVMHGVLMANHWNKNALASIQVCSIDTIRARGILPPADLMVIDEAHMFTSKDCIEFVQHEQYKDTFILAVTATPYTIESLEHLADTVIIPITMQELIDQGYLIKPRYFAPSTIDTKGLKTSLGDYVKTQMAERMSVLSGDIVKNWIENGENRPTIMFCATIQHSINMVREFNEAGVRAEHIEADTPRSERIAAIKRLGSGETKILSNVGVLCTGVDIPPASCIIFAKATKSYNLYVQMAGRGTRPTYKTGMPLDTVEQRHAAIMASNKKDFLIFDHGGNIVRHGYMTDEPEVDLKGRRVKGAGQSCKICDACYLVYSGFYCPECGPKEDIIREGPSITIEKDVKLVELNPEEEILKNEIVKFIKSKKDEAKRKGYKRGWVYHQVKDKFGEDVANEIFPKQQNKYTPGRPAWIK